MFAEDPCVVEACLEAVGGVVLIHWVSDIEITQNVTCFVSLLSLQLGLSFWTPAASDIGIFEEIEC